MWTGNFYTVEHRTSMTLSVMKYACLNHPWLQNVIEVVKSAGKDRSMDEGVQNMSYSRRNKRPGKDREKDVASSKCLNCRDCQASLCSCVLY